MRYKLNISGQLILLDKDIISDDYEESNDPSNIEYFGYNPTPSECAALRILGTINGAAYLKAQEIESKV